MCYATAKNPETPQQTELSEFSTRFHYTQLSWSARTHRKKGGMVPAPSSCHCLKLGFSGTRTIELDLSYALNLALNSPSDALFVINLIVVIASPMVEFTLHVNPDLVASGDLMLRFHFMWVRCFLTM